MPRKIIGAWPSLPAANNSLAAKLAAELKSDRDFGQPLIHLARIPQLTLVDLQQQRAAELHDKDNHQPQHEVQELHGA